MDLAMVKHEQGETLRKYMRRFFDKRATVVDVTNKEVIDLFQDGLYRCRTFEDFGRRRPSSITHLKDMITSWADEEDKANAKYDTIRGKSKQNTGGNSNNNGNQGGRSNNYSGPNRKRKPDNTVAAIQRPTKDNSKKTSSSFKDLLREVPVASGQQPQHRAVLPTPASTQGHSRATTPSRQERQEKGRRRQRRLPGTQQDGERPLRRTTQPTGSEGHPTRSLEY
jgi:hypothetical protein